MEWLGFWRAPGQVFFSYFVVAERLSNKILHRILLYVKWKSGFILGELAGEGLAFPSPTVVPPWHLLGAQLKILQAFISSFLFQWRNFSEGEMMA